MAEAVPGKRIAIVLPDLRPGGAERLHLSLAREWLRDGIGVDFVLRQARGELLAQLPAGAAVVGLDAPRVRNVIGPLARYLRRSRPDALLAAMWPLTTVAPIAARMTGFGGRVVVSEHSPLSRAYAAKGRAHRLGLRASASLGYRLASARVGVSRGVADDMAMLSRLPPSRFAVVHNPAAIGNLGAGPHVRPDALRDVRGQVVLSVGTLKPVKRHDLLLRAFAALPAGVGATLCIVGEGPERAALERQVEALGLSGRVLLPGFVADPAPWYASADLFVLSSDYEGFGNVLVEALEHGVPVVSTDCPSGPREILDDGRFGTLVPPGDEQALAWAIRESLDARHDRDALRLRAGEFSADKAAAAYLVLLLPGRKEGAST
jgi:glycosyltransferase involved in cell wall biosynthesis